ncbi:TIR domain-containing protein [Candidatus Eisenbacteria bacterium]|uniref:TIR domain-containing protein n=1 Tax=Eiseniibacteriota bacterium TaxID=2212470 RepID=A0ABV6YKL8_UNCEI
MQFFISYTGDDQTWATWIASCLERLGHTSVFQAKDVGPATNFIEFMDDSLRVSDWTIAVLSPDYLNSKPCRMEWTAALNKRRLILVRVRECEPDGLMGPLNYTDLVPLGPTEAACQRLRDVLAQPDNEIPRSDVEAEYALEWLAQLVDTKQIPDTTAAEIVQRITGMPCSRPPAGDDILSLYDGWRPRIRHSLLLDHSISDLALRELGSPVEARLQQVLFAIRTSLSVCVNVAGISFLLVPPGTVGEKEANRQTIYLSETPVSAAMWLRIMPDTAQGNPDDPKLAAVGMTVPQIKEFIERFSKESALPLDLPTQSQWRFAALAAAGIRGSGKFTQRRNTAIRVEPPSAFGLYDMTYCVWQVCRTSAAPFLSICGGCFRTQKRDELAQVSLNQQASSDDTVGFRLAIESPDVLRQFQNHEEAP